MNDEERREKSLSDLNEHLRLSRHYAGEYDTDALRALEILHKWLSIYDAEGTATTGELFALGALDELYERFEENK